MITLTRITQLPEVNISELKQLQFAIELAERSYADAAFATSTAWQMYELAIEDGNTEAKNDLAELAETREAIQKIAYEELQDAKRVLLALSN